MDVPCRSIAGSACSHCLLAGQEALLDEDVEGEELEAELAPVTLQLALTASRLGRHSEVASAHQVCSQGSPG